MHHPKNYLFQNAWMVNLNSILSICHSLHGINLWWQFRNIPKFGSESVICALPTEFGLLPPTSVKIVTGGIKCEIKWIMILIKTKILDENMPATEERMGWFYKVQRKGVHGLLKTRRPPERESQNRIHMIQDKVYLQLQSRLLILCIWPKKPTIQGNFLFIMLKWSTRTISMCPSVSRHELVTNKSGAHQNSEVKEV